MHHPWLQGTAYIFMGERDNTSMLKNKGFFQSILSLNRTYKIYNTEEISHIIDIIKYLVKSSNHYFIIVGDFSFYLLCQNFAEFQWVFSLL